MDLIVNQAAKLRYMLGGKAKVPLVIRGPQGGGTARRAALAVPGGVVHARARPWWWPPSAPTMLRAC